MIESKFRRRQRAQESRFGHLPNPAAEPGLPEYSDLLRAGKVQHGFLKDQRKLMQEPKLLPYIQTEFYQQVKELYDESVVLLGSTKIELIHASVREQVKPKHLRNDLFHCGGMSDHEVIEKLEEAKHPGGIFARQPALVS